MRRQMTLIIKLLLALFLTLGSVESQAMNADSSPDSQAEGENGNTPAEASAQPFIGTAENVPPLYSQWKLHALRQTSPIPATAAPLVIKGSDYTALSDPAAFTQGEEGALSWNSHRGWVEWEFEIPMEGLYNLGLVYDSLNDEGVDIFRTIMIDGALPYAEAEGIRLRRSFVHASYPPKIDRFGNDIRPPSREEEGWKSERLANYDTDALPLLWHLTKGKHVIRFIGVRQPIRIKELSLLPPVMLDSGNALQGTGGKQDWIQIIEAENIARKSNSGIQLQSVNDAGMSPDSKGMVRYNALGGPLLRESGQWVEWVVEVPEDGKYQIGFKYLQSYVNDFPSYRQITVDGKLITQDGSPFKFNYANHWNGYSLSNAKGDTLLIPLAKGRHTIRMTITAAPIKVLQERLLAQMSVLSRLEHDIRKITGNFEKSLTGRGNSDANRDWDLEKYMPHLREDLNGVIVNFGLLADELSGMTTGKSEIESDIRTASADLVKLRDKTREIPNRLNVFVNIQNKLSLRTYQMLYQPLMLDYLWVAQEKADLPDAAPSWIQRAAYAVKAFYRTFTIDYDFRRKDENAIDVWVNRGRDYVNLIQQLADEDFSATTGIAVNVNIVPDPQLLILGNAADIQPDVALGVDQAVPVDFASRGALADLTSFKDYNEAAQQFQTESLRVFEYQGGNYALPEVQSFNMFFYRKDILAQLKMNPPSTWQEVYRLLPTLQQNGYDFYINPKDYLTFIYQNGSELYSPDGMDTELDSEKALAGFRQWTNLFSLYRLPREVPSFFNHFRLGDIPMGIADYNTYLLIQFAAPELAGKWGMLPIPGMKQEDGSVVRWSGGSMQAGVIFNKSDKKEQAWEFLKWWTSSQTQSRFGEDLEAIYGPEYRWNTANVEAFKRIPWPEEELSALLEQKKWYKEAPQVPGGYFTARQLDFAWNRVVIEGKNVRESLELAAEEIKREMYRKQVEFHLRDERGQIINQTKSPDSLDGSNKP
ncbi:extracellular solute-binding protein [Paenibacillus sp.]|uniref:extracellular solute-binding protein n=1 Tax=Paenibacillus sp. TaxID=58172 RepID=UPI002811F91F|nr:extracellular solute-binding protein [Paenibacillus sp.]